MFCGVCCSCRWEDLEFDWTKTFFKLFLPLRGVFFAHVHGGPWIRWEEFFFLRCDWPLRGVFRTCPWRAKNISMEKRSFEQGPWKNIPENALSVAKLYL